VKSSEKFTPLPAEYLSSLPAPTIKRRIILNLYEMLVLMGVAAFLFLLPHLVIGVVFNVTAPAWFLLAHIYLVLAFYFAWYWTKSGQTLAMQTWKVQMVGHDGQILKSSQAIKRYVLGSLWLIPAAITLFISIRIGNPEKMGVYFSIIFFSVTLFLWPLSALLDRKGRQTLPDRWANTRLVQLPRSIPHPVSSSEE
jgi:uncharacterized RDD family membrane protein YckC